jgi:hypothetical protein
LSLSSREDGRLDGVREQGDEENIWTKEGGNNRRLKKIT